MLDAFTKNIKGAMEALTITFWCWSLGVLVMWGCVSWQDKKLADIPASVVAMVGVGATSNLVNKALAGKDKDEKVAE